MRMHNLFPIVCRRGWNLCAISSCNIKVKGPSSLRGILLRRPLHRELTGVGPMRRSGGHSAGGVHLWPPLKYAVPMFPVPTMLSVPTMFSVPTTLSVSAVIPVLATISITSVIPICAGISVTSVIPVFTVAWMVSVTSIPVISGGTPVAIVIFSMIWVIIMAPPIRGIRAVAVG